MVVVLFLHLKLLLLDNIDLFSQRINTNFQFINFPMRQYELHSLFILGITLDRALSQTLKRITWVQLALELLSRAHATLPRE